MNIKIFDIFNRNKKYKLVSRINYKSEESRKIYEEWDEELNIPYDLGIYLEKLINNQDIGNYYIGVHSSSAVTDMNAITEEDVLNNKIIANICNYGLINNGDLSSGVSNRGYYNEVCNTVSKPNSIFSLLLSIKSRYKKSRGAFILKFPKEFVDENLMLKNGMGPMVYDIRNGLQYIKPEFILGYVGLDKDDKYTWYPRESFLRREKNR